MKYIRVKQVKARRKELGFRSSPSFLTALDILVDRMIVVSGTWTRPQKTIKMKNIVAYCQHHRIKI